MDTKFSLARDAATAFLETGNHDDEFFLVGFNSKPYLIQDFTPDIDQLKQRLASLKPSASTALYDAVYFALEKLRNGHRTKKALLLISDGEDNVSRHRFRDTMEYVKEQDVQIYAIGTFAARYSSPKLPRRRGTDALTDLTELTGGQAVFPKFNRDLVTFCKTIAEEFRNQYVIGYRSTNPAADGQWRKIRVRLNPPQGRPHLLVHAKTGYYTPRTPVHVP
jgi:Ca-activated chloride channel family protein